MESTIYRPAYAEYAKISLLLQQATEKVITKTATPEAAAKFYDRRRQQIVGRRQDHHDLMTATWAEVRPTAPPVGRTRRTLLRGLPIAPSVVLLVVFLAGPILYCIYAAFTNMALTGQVRDPVRRLRQLHPGVLRSRVLQLGLAHAGVHGGLGDHRPERAGYGAGAADAVGLRRRAGADVCVCDRRLGAARGRRGLSLAGGAGAGRVLEH